MRSIFLLSTIFLSFFWIHPLDSAMTGGDYNIFADSFSTLQGEYATGGNFSLVGTGGEFFAATSTGGNLILRGGFQALERGSISLNVSDSDIALGQLSQNAVASSNLTLTVTTDSASGYSVTAVDDGNLRDANTGADIDDVADGEVTAGSEEYGIRATDGNGQLAADSALSGVSTVVASSNVPVSNKLTTVTFRASIDATQTRSGSYAHTVTFSAAANP